MNKLILVLCVIFSLSCMVALAEESTYTLDIWEHTFIMEDENGNSVEQTVKVALNTVEPVDLEVIQNEINDGFIGTITRDGVAPVAIAVYPADNPFSDLKDADEDSRQVFIDYMTEQYEEGMYILETHELDNGNVFIAVGDDTIRSVMSVVKNVEIELIQADFEDFSPLTSEDHAFAAEVFNGLVIE